jgi:hypothetical protein
MTIFTGNSYVNSVTAYSIIHCWRPCQGKNLGTTFFSSLILKKIFMEAEVLLFQVLFHVRQYWKPGLRQDVLSIWPTFDTLLRLFIWSDKIADCLQRLKHLLLFNECAVIHLLNEILAKLRCFVRELTMRSNISVRWQFRQWVRIRGTPISLAAK